MKTLCYMMIMLSLIVGAVAIPVGLFALWQGRLGLAMVNAVVICANAGLIKMQLTILQKLG